MKYAGNIEGVVLERKSPGDTGSGHGNFELPAGILNWSSEDVKFGVTRVQTVLDTTKEDESLERTE